MTYQQYTDHLKLCQYLGKEPLGEFKEFHDFISDLWKDMTFSVINDHNEQCIIFHKGTDFFMQQDFKNGKLKCQWDRIWSFFLIKKGMEIPELKDFIQSMVEQHLKCKVLTPFEYHISYAGRGGTTPQMQGSNTPHVIPQVEEPGGTTPQMQGTGYRKNPIFVNNDLPTILRPSQSLPIPRNRTSG
jgi:hypothetical protein